MSKIKDSLIGFAIGDAMGVPVEFEDRSKLLKNPVTRMLGYGSYGVPEGTWSDDTSMTLATMDSIIKCNGNINYNDIADRFCNWVNKAEYTATDEVFDIGITTKYALMRYMEKKEHAELCGGTAFNENGNGSLMRMLPIAFYCYFKNITENKEIYEIVKNVSSITHAHEISILGCYIYVRYMLFLLHNKDKYSAYNMIKVIDYNEFFSTETIKEYERILNNDIKKCSINDINSTGFVVHTLETALWLTLNSEKYSDSIIGAINLGGDTDTIAGITGSITGLIYGYENIPDKWTLKLRKIDYLKSMSIAFEESFKDKIFNPILGAIIGDIVGSRFEINDCKDENFELFSEYCRFTDDTVMTLAIAKSLKESDKNSLKEQSINNMVELGKVYSKCGFGPSFYKWIFSESHEPYNSYGNGAAMRISACGYYADSLEELKNNSNIITGVSHNHPDGIKGAEAVATLIYLAKEKYNKEYLKDYFESNFYSLNYDIEKIKKDHKFKITCEATVPQAVKSFYNSLSFEDAIRRAIMLGGDSDTIGAICGSISGMYYGISKEMEDKALSYLPDDLKKIYFETKKEL